jgi:hypothetical protein
MLIDESSNCILFRKDPTQPSSGDPIISCSYHTAVRGRSCLTDEAIVIAGLCPGGMVNSRCYLLPKCQDRSSATGPPKLNLPTTTSSQLQHYPLQLHHIHNGWFPRKEVPGAHRYVNCTRTEPQLHKQSKSLTELHSPPHVAFLRLRYV